MGLISMPLDRKGACFIIFFHRKKSISLYEFSFCDQSFSNYDDVPFVLFQLTTAARKVMLRSRPRPPRRQAPVPRGGTSCTAAATCSNQTATKTSRRPRDTVKCVNQPRRLFFPDTVFQKSVNKSAR